MTRPLRTWWHELNTWEPEVALAFYHRTLGWEFEHTMLPDGDSYWIAHQSGKPVGGIYALREPEFRGIPSHWMTYLAVTDIAQAERSAVFAGGEVCRPAVVVPGVGKLSIVCDSTGAIIGLMEPESGHVLKGSSISEPWEEPVTSIPGKPHLIVGEKPPLQAV
jgi:predicted enzyme related to lactoylglutathione lyase